MVVHVCRMRSNGQISQCLSRPSQKISEIHDCKFFRRNSIILCTLNKIQACNYKGFLGVWTPALFFKRIKVPFFLENCESSVKKCNDVVIIKLECCESRIIPVISLPFLEISNILSKAIFSLKKFSVDKTPGLEKF